MSDAVGDWLEGLRRLDPHAIPPPGLFRSTWPAVLDYAIRFVQERGDEALENGWTCVELLGIHPEAGAMRADCTGVLIVYRPVTVVSIAPRLISLSNGQRARGMVNSAQSVPIWNFRAPRRDAQKTIRG